MWPCRMLWGEGRGGWGGGERVGWDGRSEAHARDEGALTQCRAHEPCRQCSSRPTPARMRPGSVRGAEAGRRRSPSVAGSMWWWSQWCLRCARGCCCCSICCHHRVCGGAGSEAARESQGLISARRAGPAATAASSCRSERAAGRFQDLKLTPLLACRRQRRVTSGVFGGSALAG